METNEQPITWTLKKIKANQLKPNPKNPKQADKKGESRLRKSLSKFGVVFDGIANADNCIIDGHSRLKLKENPNAVLRYFFPSRQLTEAEYTEMNAMFDMAKAGKPDLQIMEEIFTEEQMTEWDIKPVSLSGQQNDEYTRRFEVVVECRDEAEQQEIFNQLTQEGHTCRVLQL